LALASALVTVRVSHIWTDYRSLIRGSALDRNFYPTLPTLFRVLINVNLSWLALVPSCIAIAWGLAYYWKKRANWDWKYHGMPVMLATILSSPYGWMSDQVVLLPAVASGISSSRRRFAMEILTGINIAAFLLGTMSSRLAIWIPAAWLAWYLYAAPAQEHRNSRGEEGSNRNLTATANASSQNAAGS
jgi:hypothetical protein